jgi:hypothetical protein
MKITTITLENTGAVDLTNAPVTFGQVFAPGDLPRGAAIDGMQLDVKSSHPDGSVRHAVLSLVAPVLLANEQRPVDLVRAIPPQLNRPAATAVDAAFRVLLTIGGARYEMGAADIVNTWLAGPVVTEKQFRAPLVGADGTPHPHLHARGGVRQYKTGQRRVEIVLENDWAYEPGPQNFTYDVRVELDGAVVYERAGLEHYHHARWRKTFWTGAKPTVHVRHDTAYLIKTRAVPNYEQIAISEKTLARYADIWTGPSVEPMGIGPLVNPYMPTTGGRNDLGLMPGWYAAYLLSQDPRAKRVTLGTARLAGSWSIHYRDRATDLPVSLIDHPYMTILGTPTDTKNPITKQQEAFPKRAASTSKTPYVHDSSHQPAFSYLPYLVTGEYFHLEELQFWAMYNLLQHNPGWRKGILGLVSRDQVRGQAWSLRTLGEAAYITPDTHPLKRHFNALLSSNLSWYLATFVDNPQTGNELGVITSGPAVVYRDSLGVAPWMDDFFTSALGHLVDLGFTQAGRLLQWKARFPIGRMISPGFPWMMGAHYSLAVRATETGPFFTSFHDVYATTAGPEIVALRAGGLEWRTALGKLDSPPGVRKENDMAGYSSSPTGYPSNMQPALAYAADYAGEQGKRAWQQFMARAVKPDYSTAPQFNIVPRGV